MTRRTALCLPLALLFLASVNPSKAQKTAVEAQAEADGEEGRVAVAAGAPLTVECRLRPEQRAEWRRDGQAPPPDMRAAPEAPAPDARLAARLRAPAARAHHAGLYTCSRERDHRVRVLVLPAPTALTALTGEAPAAASPAPAPAPAPPAPVADAADLLYDVRGNITLLCRLPNENSLAYVWKKNGSSVEEAQDLKGRYVLERGGAEFHVKHSVEADFGNYSCALAGRAAEQLWDVRGRPHLKLPANSNVVEGQKLKLVCKVVGKPYPRVAWLYSNSSDADANFTEAAAALGARATLAASEQGVPDGALLLDAAARADAGRYRCVVPATPSAAPAETVLRVKDMYAALWPFLGICAEVFVLCAIILLYEKRRTKPELDDSDTDNHDQKKS